MKRLAVALMLSASAAAGVVGTALAATGGQTPPASAAQPNNPVDSSPSNPMSGAGVPGGMMAFQREESGMMPMMAMMRMMTMMMGTGPNMAGFMTGGPMMGGSSAGAADTHSPSH